MFSYITFRKKTLLITGNIENIADMPCNPSIGGPAKGIVVRENDACNNDIPVDMFEIDIRNSWEILGKIIWESYSEELINQLFS